MVLEHGLGIFPDFLLQILRSIHGYQPPSMDDDYPLTRFAHLGQNMGTKNDRPVLGKVLYERANFLNLTGIKTDGGFKDEDIRIVE